MTKHKDRTLSQHREFDAPIELMWKLWTQPEHIRHWWGPTGFTNTISKMEIKKDGIWEFMMHGPDGIDYPNKYRYLEVVENQKLVFRDLTGMDFQTTVLFEPTGNGGTLVKMSMLFKSAEQLKQVIEEFKAEDGLKQNLDKLENYLITPQQTSL